MFLRVLGQEEDAEAGASEQPALHKTENTIHQLISANIFIYLRQGPKQWALKKLAPESDGSTCYRPVTEGCKDRETTALECDIRRFPLLTVQYGSMNPHCLTVNNCGSVFHSQASDEGVQLHQGPQNCKQLLTGLRSRQRPSVGNPF